MIGLQRMARISAIGEEETHLTCDEEKDLISMNGYVIRMNIAVKEYYGPQSTFGDKEKIALFCENYILYRLNIEQRQFSKNLWVPITPRIISKATGISDLRTIKRKLKILEEENYLVSKHQPKTPNGEDRPKLFTFHPKRFPHFLWDRSKSVVSKKHLAMVPDVSTQDPNLSTGGVKQPPKGGANNPPYEGSDTPPYGGANNPPSHYPEEPPERLPETPSTRTKDTKFLTKQKAEENFLLEKGKEAEEEKIIATSCPPEYREQIFGKSLLRSMPR